MASLAQYAASLHEAAAEPGPIRADDARYTRVVGHVIHAAAIALVLLAALMQAS